MNITDELCRLAELRQKGHLTEQEFADAKRQLLLQGNAKPSTFPKSQYEKPGDGFIPIEEKTYQSSRWTSRNIFFPDALVLASDGIIFRKGNLFGSTEEHISFNAVASFRIMNGILFSTISIETSGGSQPIVVNGLWKAEAKEIQDILREFQRQAQR
jgi:hypothetical protein